MQVLGGESAMQVLGAPLVDPPSPSSSVLSAWQGCRVALPSKPSSPQALLSAEALFPEALFRPKTLLESGSSAARWACCKEAVRSEQSAHAELRTICEPNLGAHDGTSHLNAAEGGDKRKRSEFNCPRPLAWFLWFGRRLVQKHPLAKFIARGCIRVHM